MNNGSGVVLSGRQPRGSFQEMPVEHYDPATGAITVKQAALFPGESGWQVTLSNRLCAAQEMSDGRYLWMATRVDGGSTHYRLFTFDPADVSIESLPLLEKLPDSSYGSLTQVLVDAPRDQAYILVLIPQTSGHPELEVIAIDTNTGSMVQSSNSFAPGYSLGGAEMQVLEDGRIFVSGGTSDGSNFNPVNHTLLITPPDVQTDNWYADATDMGNGWRWSAWLGSFNVSFDPWIYHAQHGWLLVWPDGPESVFFWDD